VTTREVAVPAHFGLAPPVAVAEAIHTHAIPERRLTELAPLVFVEAERDALASRLIERLAAEVADFVRAAIDRLQVRDLVPEVLLGGGLMQAADGRLVQASVSRLADLGIEAVVRAVASPPIVGAALSALDDIEADGQAHARARAELESVAAERGWHDADGAWTMRVASGSDGNTGHG
jgi:hypothetical protein